MTAIKFVTISALLVAICLLLVAALGFAGMDLGMALVLIPMVIGSIVAHAYVSVRR